MHKLTLFYLSFPSNNTGLSTFNESESLIAIESSKLLVLTKVFCSLRFENLKNEKDKITISEAPVNNAILSDFEKILLIEL